MIKKTKVENGIVSGIPAADPRITAFLGVPFAAPPVGNLRWKAPQPARDWDGELAAYKFAPISMQATPGLSKTDIYTREWNVDPEIPMSEDCLYLNIWTPAANTDERLPVFVWYFGGGLQVGNTAEMEFNGERIARRGIVVVTINYRVNVFGFLAHPELTAESPDFPTNFGNLDQKFGTEWVKRNITAFGGDPDNITIGGQSAGGGSVLTQLTSPLNEGLFQKAIVQSGCMFGAYAGFRLGRAQDLAAAEKEGQDFFNLLGVKTLAEARALDAFYIRDKNNELKKFWGTVADNNYIVGNSMELMLKNKRHMVPLLMGHTTSEFLSAPDAASFEDLEKQAREKFGDRADEFLALCKADNLADTLKKATFSPIELGIRTIFNRTAETENAPDNYYYIFDGDIPGWDNPGTFHSVDLWFFFETLGVCWRPFTGRHYDLARQMCNYWSNFIRNGNPNGDDIDGSPMPEWAPFAKAESPMIFAEKPKMNADSGKSGLIKFMEDYYLNTDQTYKI
jgi:para-nitrobenzyl esterase